jgi:predicted helicase
MKEENQILKEQLIGVDNWPDLKVRLEKYNTSQSETTSKKTIAGKIFEIFAKAYFIIEPEQNQLYENVWLYDEVPLTIKEKLNLPQRDFGIDLLLQDKQNRFVAVQCKFKNDEQSKLNWTKDKIGNTFGLAEKCDFVIVFTNASNIHSVAQSREKFRFIGYADLLNLKSSDFAGFNHYFKTNKTPAFKKLSPLPHQTQAINSVIEHFNKNDRGQLILPCGAGKTLAALWINEKINAKNSLVLFPSLALLRQFKTEWSRNRSFDFDYICICSEKDIDKNKEDTTVTHTYEISGEVTTNPDRLVNFLSGNNHKIVFSTYQSIEVTTKALAKKQSFNFDLIICDEAHRTAGSKANNLFTLIHDNTKVRGYKRLYMTAMYIRFSVVDS